MRSFATNGINFGSTYTGTKITLNTSVIYRHEDGRRRQNILHAAYQLEGCGEGRPDGKPGR